MHVGVSHAILLDRDSMHEGENVTVRVSKYLGPNRDCHGSTRVRVRDMFPLDDHQTNAENCGILQIKYAHGLVKTVDYMSEAHVGVTMMNRWRL